MPHTEPSPEELRAGLARLLNRSVTGLERIGGGRNSRVYNVATGGSERFALKIYFRHAGDPRDRLATEYGSFSYLWAQGFREIPEPVAADTKAGWAVYRFIEGDKIPPGRAGNAEVEVAADFLGRLRDLSRQAGSRNLGVASEAFFTLNEIVESVRRRLSRLDAAAGEEAIYTALRSFLEADFRPFLERAARWSEARWTAAGGSVDRELDPGERTLSPSDFGFHNALRQPDGRIIFLDFEYFGWDDPAKMIADFLLHPAMQLSPEAEDDICLGAVPPLFRLARPAGAGGERLSAVWPEVVHDHSERIPARRAPAPPICRDGGGGSFRLAAAAIGQGAPHARPDSRGVRSFSLP